MPWSGTLISLAPLAADLAAKYLSKKKDKNDDVKALAMEDMLREQLSLNQKMILEIDQLKKNHIIQQKRIAWITIVALTSLLISATAFILMFI